MCYIAKQEPEYSIESIVQTVSLLQKLSLSTSEQ